MAKNGQKWPKMAKNGQKWPKIAKNRQKSPKIAKATSICLFFFVFLNDNAYVMFIDTIIKIFYVLDASEAGPASSEAGKQGSRPCCACAKGNGLLPCFAGIKHKILEFIFTYSLWVFSFLQYKFFNSFL